MKKILTPLSVSLLLVALIAYFLASDSGEQYEEYDGTESVQQAAEQGEGTGGAAEQAGGLAAVALQGGPGGGLAPLRLGRLRDHLPPHRRVSL